MVRLLPSHSLPPCVLEFLSDGRLADCPSDLTNDSDSFFPWSTARWAYIQVELT